MRKWTGIDKDILKIQYMEATPEEKKIAMATVMQLVISVIVLLGMMITSWVSLQSDQAAMKVRIEQLEKGREQNAFNIETIRKENREDHKEILDELKDLNRRLIETKTIGK
jgi:hypothetical protein